MRQSAKLATGFNFGLNSVWRFFFFGFLLLFRLNQPEGDRERPATMAGALLFVAIGGGAKEDGGEEETGEATLDVAAVAAVELMRPDDRLLTVLGSLEQVLPPEAQTRRLADGSSW